jgi:tRNA threonylcarbamoyl adenosine modification protein YjeE
MILDFYGLTQLPKQFKVNSLLEFHALARSFVRQLIEPQIFTKNPTPKAQVRVLLYGELGVGKTEWVKACLEALEGFESSSVSSPTYTYHQKYRVRPKFQMRQNYDGIDAVDHFDLYRVKNLEQAENLGILELIMESRLAFIEWPDLIELDLSQMQSALMKTFQIRISTEENGHRCVGIFE